MHESQDKFGTFFYSTETIESHIVWQNNLNPSIFVCDQEMQKVWVRRLLYETDLGSMPASIIITSFSQQMLYKISRLNIEMRKMKKPCQKIAVPFTRFLPLLETSTRKKNKWSTLLCKVRNEIQFIAQFFQCHIR